jgi:hypothetical protein
MMADCSSSSFRFTFTHKNVRKFHTSGFDLGDAFAGLNLPVKNFQIYGDLPGEAIEHLTHKFGVSAGAGAPSEFGPCFVDCHLSHCCFLGYIYSCILQARYTCP